MQKKKHSLEFEKPLLDLEKQLDDLVKSSKDSDLDFTNEIKAIEKKDRANEEGGVCRSFPLAKGTTLQAP